MEFDTVNGYMVSKVLMEHP